MATGTNGIATRQDCNLLHGTNLFTSDLSKCVTQAEVVNTGKLKCSGGSSTTKLARYSDISIVEENVGYLNFRGSLSTSGNVAFNLYNSSANGAYGLGYPNTSSGTVVDQLKSGSTGVVTVSRISSVDPTTFNPQIAVLYFDDFAPPASAPFVALRILLSNASSALLKSVQLYVNGNSAGSNYLYTVQDVGVSGQFINWAFPMSNVSGYVPAGIFMAALQTQGGVWIELIGG